MSANLSTFAAYLPCRLSLAVVVCSGGAGGNRTPGEPRIDATCGGSVRFACESAAGNRTGVRHASETSMKRLIAVAALFLAACGGGGGDPEPEDGRKPSPGPVNCDVRPEVCK